MPQEIPINDSSFKIIVDNEDYERVNKQDWYYYEQVNVRITTSIKNRVVPLANFVMNDFISMYDHKDRNKLNNQKSNLRKCNYSQNAINKEKWVMKSSSKYKGVSYHKSTGKWRARIRKNYKHIHIGVYFSEIEAAKAYNEIAQKLFGEFAYLNEVDNA